jgi:hypothetical protein
MKPNLEVIKRNGQSVTNGSPKPPRPAAGPEAAAKVALPGNLRRLKWNELVCRGDFVADERQGFEPWEGPAGFQAASFLKPIYRLTKAVLPQDKN